MGDFPAHPVIVTMARANRVPDSHDLQAITVFSRTPDPLQFLRLLRQLSQDHYALKAGNTPYVVSGGIYDDNATIADLEKLASRAK